MTVFLNANSISELQFHPPGESRRGGVAVSVNNKKYIEDFFPEAMKLLSYDYMSVEIFKYKFTKLIKGVLQDIGSLVKSELAQYDRDEKTRDRLMEETKEVMPMGTDQGGWLHPNLRSKGIKFNGIPTQTKSHKEQKRLLTSAIYYRNLKSLILMRIDQEYWFSLPAMKMFAERERELEQLTDELNTDVKLYNTKAAYSAASAAVSTVSFAAEAAVASKLTKSAAASVALKNVPLPIATKNVTAAYALFKVKEMLASTSAGIGFMVAEDKHVDEIRNVSRSTTEPIDCMRPFGIVGKGLQLIPHVGFSAGVVNTVAYFAAARSTKSTIESNKRLFKEMKYSHFKKLSKLICNDFNELQDNEIEALMLLLGISKNEYLSL